MTKTWTNLSKNRSGVNPPFIKYAILAYFRSIQHGPLGGVSQNAKSPHNVPYSKQTTSQCSSGKSGRPDRQTYERVGKIYHLTLTEGKTESKGVYG